MATLHPPVVIEYLGDRDKKISIDAITHRIFRENDAFDGARVLVETDSEVLKFCEARPQLFRRRTDLETALVRKDMLTDMAEHVEEFLDLLYPGIRARLLRDGLVVKAASAAPKKKPAKKPVEKQKEPKKEAQAPTDEG